MQWFNFCFPIGWDELSAIATSVAVFIALMANYSSNKQLKKALQMHEQSKGIELLDKRIAWVRKIESDNISSDLEFSILFNGEINRYFSKLKMLKDELKKLENDLVIYDDFLCEAYPDTDENSPIALIRKAEGKVLFFEFSEDKVREFEDLCKQYEVRTTYGASEGEYRTYNYKTITDSIQEKKEAINSCKTELTDAMLEFIGNSIEPLVKEG